MDIPTDAILKPVTSDYNTRGHTMKFERPTARVDSYLFSFFPSAIKIWNSLPTDLINCTSIETFKQKLAGLALI